MTSNINKAKAALKEIQEVISDKLAAWKKTK